MSSRYKCLALPFLVLALASWVARAGFDRSNWMGETKPLLENVTLLDITLPGTHDSMTWDLSDTISDNANDLPPDLSWLFHDIHDVDGVGKFIHKQAQSQVLNMTEQLDAGIRFIDFRVAHSSGPNASSTGDKHWYCLHLVQSNHYAVEYLKEARRWMEAHPTEVVVFWISHHGSPCDNHYHSNTTVQQQFFNDVLAIFNGLLFQGGRLNETTVGQLQSSNQRAVLYISQYHNMTGGGSPYAMDACLIDNQLGDSSSDITGSRTFLLHTFKKASERRQRDKAQNRLFLLSMSGGAPRVQMEQQALLNFAPNWLKFNRTKETERCAAAFNNPGMTDWCPSRLLDCVQLANYYNQYPLELTVSNSTEYTLPHAIYINAVGRGGTILTGSRYDDTKAYSYVDTLILANVLRAGGCDGTNSSPSSTCTELVQELQGSRSKNPLQLWSDPKYGRHVDWPSQN